MFLFLLFDVEKQQSRSNTYCQSQPTSVLFLGIAIRFVKNHHRHVLGGLLFVSILN